MCIVKLELACNNDSEVCRKLHDYVITNRSDVLRINELLISLFSIFVGNTYLALLLIFGCCAIHHLFSDIYIDQSAFSYLIVIILA